jgi:hypothetical protein
MKDDLKVGQTVYVSEWLIDFKDKVNSHSLLINSHTIANNSVASKLATSFVNFVYTSSEYSKLPKGAKDGIKQFLIKIGDLFVLPEKEHYHITSAYAHDVLYTSFEKGHDIPILMYPSVTSGHETINFAIHPRFADSDMMSLVHVMKLNIKSKGEDGTIETSLSEIGFTSDDKAIVWKKPAKSDIRIAYDEFIIVTDNGTTFKGEGALSLCVDHTKYTVSDMFDRDFDSLLKHMPDTPLKVKDIKHDLNLPVIQRLDIDFVQGNEVMTPKGLSRIKRMSFDISYVSCYR